MILLTLLILLLILTTNIILCNVINDIDTNTTINDNELDIKRKHYHKSRTYDIVIAHCKKDMNWIIELMNLCNDYKLRIFIYSKCGNIEKLNNLKLEKGNSCLKIISLDNYGREAYVYLWHIIYHYDRLPTMTFFMQDDTKEKENFNIISELINVLNSRNGFYSLSHTINPMGTFDADTLKRIFLADWADPFFYQRIIKGQQLWYTNWRATFGVSSTRINHLPIEAYKAAITVSNCSGSGYNLCHDDYFEGYYYKLFLYSLISLLILISSYVGCYVQLLSWA